MAYETTAIRAARDRILRLKQRHEAISTIDKYKKLDQYKSLRNLLVMHGPLVVIGAVLNAPLLIGTGLTFTALSVLRRMYRNNQFKDPVKAKRLYDAALELIRMSAEHANNQLNNALEAKADRQAR